MFKNKGGKFPAKCVKLISEINKNSENSTSDPVEYQTDDEISIPPAIKLI